MFRIRGNKDSWGNRAFLFADNRLFSSGFGLFSSAWGHNWPRRFKVISIDLIEGRSIR